MSVNGCVKFQSAWNSSFIRPGWPCHTWLALSYLASLVTPGWPCHTWLALSYLAGLVIPGSQEHMLQFAWIMLLSILTIRHFDRRLILVMMVMSQPAEFNAVPWNSLFLTWNSYFCRGILRCGSDNN